MVIANQDNVTFNMSFPFDNTRAKNRSFTEQICRVSVRFCHYCYCDCHCYCSCYCHGNIFIFIVIVVIVTIVVIVVIVIVVVVVVVVVVVIRGRFGALWARFVPFFRHHPAFLLWWICVAMPCPLSNFFFLSSAPFLSQEAGEWIWLIRFTQ